MEYVVTETKCGKIKGVSEDGVNKYFGIRFANAKRFEYAEEVTEWEGLYEALNYGAAPIQARAYDKYIDRTSHYEVEFMQDVKASYSEDCLFLNIWAPKDKKDCPVLVVIYGGGLLTGQADEKEFDGTEFAKRGIVVVTFNYRVNVFGLCAFKELEDKDGKCGNYCYYDQYTAFQWIIHNIRDYGGNEKQMTLIGQSAGAASVETQIKSPLNEGIFQGAILQSSAGFCTAIKTRENHEKVYALWHKIYEESGCKNVDEFKRYPADKLFALFKEQSNKNPLAFSVSLHDNNFNGDNTHLPCKTKIISSMTSEDTMPLIFYFMIRFLNKSQRNTAETYNYYFSRQLPGDTKGAWHSSDLWYTYGTLDKCWRPFEDADKELSNKMMQYFSNFIGTGNPNGNGLTEWLPAKKGQKKFLCFDTDSIEMKKPSVWKIIYSTLFKKRVGNGL